MEKHVAELNEHAVAYINSDSNGRGYLEVGGSQTLETFANAVAKDIPDPEMSMSVWKRKQLRLIAEASSEEERNQRRGKPAWPIDALGSGSDYTAFLDFAGVASLNLAYGGADESNGVYHSAYDDFYWFTHFDDPTFGYGRALAQTAGTAVMRLADADLLPFNFGDLSASVGAYVGDLKRLEGRETAAIRDRNREIAEGVFNVSSDPGHPLRMSCAAGGRAPQLNFAPLDAARDELTRAADHYQRSWALAGQTGGASLAFGGLDKVNEELLAANVR